MEVVRREVDAVRRREWGALVPLWDPLVLIRTDPKWPEQGVYGRENAVAWMRGVLESGVGNDLFADEMVDLGDRVLMHMRWRMRGEESGVEGEMRWSQIDTVRNGQIVLIEYFLNQNGALKAIGMAE